MGGTASGSHWRLSDAEYAKLPDELPDFDPTAAGDTAMTDSTQDYPPIVWPRSERVGSTRCVSNDFTSFKQGSRLSP